MFVNDEGKLEQLPVSAFVIDDGRISDFTAGTVIFCRCDDEGEDYPLTESEIEFVMHEQKDLLFLHAAPADLRKDYRFIRTTTALCLSQEAVCEGEVE